jgi:hypothetical protein
VSLTKGHYVATGKTAGPGAQWCKASSVVPRWVNQISEEESSMPTSVGATRRRTETHSREKET